MCSLQLELQPEFYREKERLQRGTIGLIPGRTGAENKFKKYTYSSVCAQGKRITSTGKTS